MLEKIFVVCPEGVLVLVGYFFCGMYFIGGCIMIVESLSLAFRGRSAISAMESDGTVNVTANRSAGRILFYFLAGILLIATAAYGMMSLC